MLVYTATARRCENVRQTRPATGLRRLPAWPEQEPLRRAPAPRLPGSHLARFPRAAVGQAARTLRRRRLGSLPPAAPKACFTSQTSIHTCSVLREVALAPLLKLPVLPLKTHTQLSSLFFPSGPIVSIPVFFTSLLECPTYNKYPTDYLLKDECVSFNNFYFKKIIS